MQCGTVSDDLCGKKVLIIWNQSHALEKLSSVVTGLRERAAADGGNGEVQLENVERLVKGGEGRC